MHEQRYPSNPTPLAPSGAPAPARHTGAWLALSGLVALLLVAGGLAVFGPFRAVATTQASALPASRAAAATTDAGPISGTFEIPTGVEVPSADDVPAVPGGAPTGNPGSPGNPSNSGNPANPSSSGAGSPGGAPTPQPAPTAPTPVITSFETPESIDCHNGDFQMFTASWSTANAVKVTISIDGPGVYKTYGPTGSDSLPFSCSTPHTFLLTAYAHDGSSVSHSITLHPRNVQMPDTGDEDADTEVAPASTPDDEI